MYTSGAATAKHACGVCTCIWLVDRPLIEGGANYINRYVHIARESRRTAMDINTWKLTRIRTSLPSSTDESASISLLAGSSS